VTKDEALRLAWEALHQIAEVSATDYEYQQWASEAITAIKAALEADTWVGLTDEEVWECYSGQGSVFYRAIEAKLKEKNCSL
jgi:hypothetical protein